MWTCGEKYSCMLWHISLFFYPSRYNPYTIEVWRLFNVWVTENRIRRTLPVYVSCICQECAAVPVQLASRVCLPVGPTPWWGGSQGSPSTLPSVDWVCGSCSSEAPPAPTSKTTLRSWMRQDLMWEAMLVQRVKMFPSCMDCDGRADFNCSSCMEVNTGTAPHLLFWCNKVMWEGRIKSTWCPEVSCGGTIWIYRKRHGHA